MRLAPAAAAFAAVCSLAATAGAAGPPSIDARAWLVENSATGEVLVSHDARYQTPIASITKLMTVIVALQHLKLTDVVRVDPRAAEVGQESVFLEPNQRITVGDLVKAALIQSANDAADALALSIAPDYPSFAKLMNEEAAALGMDDTQFVRPDGLDAPGAYSSAADVTRLARILMRTRFIRETVGEETDTIAGGRTLHTWDDLLSLYPPTIGVKTGHTNAAGWCQVAAARGRGVTVYATLLGSPTRSERNVDLESLLVWGLGQFRVVPAVDTGRPYAEVQVPYGRAPLTLVAAKPLLAVARLGRRLTQTVTAPAVVSLPVRAGAVLGRVEIRAGGRVVGTRDLVASRTINKPGLPRRLAWYAGRTLHHLGHLF